jgi:hypothetical protein
MWLKFKHLGTTAINQNLGILKDKNTQKYNVTCFVCETSSFTVRKEHELGMFENKLLRKFRCKREEVTEGWRKLHTEELCNLYVSLNIIVVIKLRRTRWAEHVTCMREMRNAYEILVGKP